MGKENKQSQEASVTPKARITQLLLCGLGSGE